MWQSPERHRLLLRSSQQLQRHSKILIMVERKKRTRPQNNLCRNGLKSFLGWVPSRALAPEGRLSVWPVSVSHSVHPASAERLLPVAPGLGQGAGCQPQDGTPPSPWPASPGPGDIPCDSFKAKAPEVNVFVQTGVWEVGSQPPCPECCVGGGGRQLAVLPGPGGPGAPARGAAECEGQALKAQGLAAGASARGAF